MKETRNRFERHRAWTIIAVLVITIPAIDFFAARTYRLVYGYSWPDSRVRAYEKIERIYRTGSPFYHHDLKKNMSVDSAGYGNLKYNVRTNSLGFRDGVVRDVPLSSQKYRVLFIGDSFTEGIGFDYDDTFVGLLGGELSSRDIEVFNAAAVSYSPVIYWRKVKYLIEDVGFKFDEAVVFLDISDIYDETVNYDLDAGGNVIYAGAGSTANRRNIGCLRRAANSSRSFIMNNSILTYYILRSLHGAFSRNDLHCETAKWSLDSDSYEKYYKRGMERCGFYMDKLHNLLEVRGIALTVVVYPWPDQIMYGGPDSAQVIYWKKWCEARNVKFINLFPVFLTGRTDAEKNAVIRKYFVRGNTHFNKNGHKLAADVFLKERYADSVPGLFQRN